MRLSLYYDFVYRQTAADDAFRPVWARHDDLAAALDDLAARTQAALGGEMESHIVTKDSPAIALS